MMYDVGAGFARPIKNMELILHRRFFGEEYTIGSLYIGSEYFCDTLKNKAVVIRKFSFLHYTVILGRHLCTRI